MQFDSCDVTDSIVTGPQHTFRYNAYNCQNSFHQTIKLIISLKFHKELLKSLLLQLYVQNKTNVNSCHVTLSTEANFDSCDVVDSDYVFLKLFLSRWLRQNCQKILP